MPLAGFKSTCSKREKIIVSEEKGKTHRAHNVNRAYVTRYQIDGYVIQTGTRCDFLLINEDKKNAYLIELKGSDLVKAADQLRSTEVALRRELCAYRVFFRIVASKCRTHAIQDSEFKKFQIQKGSALQYGENMIEENI